MGNNPAITSEGVLTDCERFLRVMRGQPVDRVPNHELALWGQTVERWFGEGLPRDVHVDGIMRGNEYFGLDRREFLGVSVDMVPPFDEETLEETERYVTYRDRKGIVRRALKEGEARGMRASMDQYLSFPVSCREDFLALKARYNPRSPARYAQWWGEQARILSQRDYPLCLLNNGTFGFYSKLREWMGTEALSYALYDQPGLVEEMLDFLVDFLRETVHRALHEVRIDYFNFFEDMAGKGGPLMSPAMFRRFLVPRYRKVVDFLRSHGVEFIIVDSDGYTVPLIPLWLEVGVDGHWPVEIAAGMDPLELRRQFGKDLILWGGIDKRELAKDRAAIERELYGKVPALLEQGRYIPTVDHAVPPDVPFGNFMYYLELKGRLLEGRG